MSLRPSTGWPCACSGEMYAAVPNTADVCGAVCGPATIRAIPKSMTLTSPLRVTMTFAGLMSRWITPATCAYASASQIFSATSTACGSGGEAAARAHEVLERPPLDELHHDELRLAVGAGVVDADDVRVVQAGGGLRLAAEAVDEARIACELRQQDLDRDGAVEDGVDPAVHLAHAAGADPGFHPVPAAQHRSRSTTPSLPSPSGTPRAPASRSARPPGRPSPRSRGRRRPRR